MTAYTKYIFAILLAGAYSAAAIAQTSQVSGEIIDSLQQPIPGANVVFSSTTDSTYKSGTATNANGQFSLRVNPGYYKIDISFLGFETVSKKILIEHEQVNLGKITLSESNFLLGEVTVVGNVLPVIVNGDTTEINAAAYKTNPDADASDLIGKMPTVTVNNNTIQAEGEDVKKVLVDGKPFFGNDPNAALKSLPAEAIEKIQVFDDLSDQAKLTGFDDGNSEKTINIITKAEFKNGTFGYVSGGYGTDDRYRVNGVANHFNGDERITVVAQSNNINQQNFATSDLAGVTAGNSSGGRRGGPPRPGNNVGGDASDFLVGEEDGLVNTNAVGINYSNQFGKKITFNASYFYNRTNNSVLSNTERQYFSDSANQQYFEDENASSINQNHRLNVRVKYEINDNNTIIYTPSLTLQQYEGSSLLNTKTWLSNAQISSSLSDYNSNLTTYQLNNELMWQHKFAKRGRTVGIHLSQEHNPTEAINYLQSASGNNTFIDTLNQESDLNQFTNEYSARLMYTEPLGKKTMLKMFLGTSYNTSESDKQTFAIDSVSDTQTLQPALSSVFESEYITQEGGIGFMHRLGGKSMFMFDTRFQNATLETRQEFPLASDATRNYTAFLPMGMFRYQTSKNSNLRIMFRTQTSVPTVSQLQGVIDNSNPQQLTTGNPNLDQQYQFNLFARYNKTNPTKATTFFAMAGGTASNNYIGTSTTIAQADTINVGGTTLAPGTQLSMPVNLDGYYNLRAFSTFGFPLQKIKSNLNINLSAQYTRSPGMVNNEINYTQSPTVGLGAVLSSNISEKVDFTLSSNSSMNYSLSSLNATQNTQYFNQTTSLKIYWNFWEGLVYRTNISHEYYNGLSESFNSNYVIWNMSLGYKFMKDKRAEVGIEAFDILNQNQSLTRATTDTYYEDVWTNTLQQYFMLTFRYNFGQYNGSKKADKNNEPEEMRPPRPH